MQVETQAGQTPAGKAIGKTRLLLDSIKFEHTIFALPFAYLGMALAARGTHGWPGWDKLLWVTLAMVGARTVAMSLNRLIDAQLDARNPRTATGAAEEADPPGGVLALAIGSGALLAFSAYQLNPVCFALLPVAALFLVGYSYTKRFTWLCHLFLGLTDGIAPIGGWLAVNPTLSVGNLLPPLLLGLAVAAWVGGFDILYACQDIEFDRANGLHSIRRASALRARYRSRRWRMAPRLASWRRSARCWGCRGPSGSASAWRPGC